MLHQPELTLVRARNAPHRYAPLAHKAGVVGRRCGASNVHPYQGHIYTWLGIWIPNGGKLRKNTEKTKSTPHQLQTSSFRGSARAKPVVRRLRN